MTTNYERAFASHPEVYAAWQALNGAIKSQMDLRRYELVTLAAAMALRSSYCSLAHGRVLHEHFDDVDVAAILRDRQRAGLDDVDLAAMELAERVVHDAASIDESARERLVSLGASDHDVDLVVLAAAARCFFSKSLDGLGASPDSTFRELPTDLLDALVVGRPIEVPPEGPTQASGSSS